jgi:predicted DNA-binding transcriptional regulator YafY
MAKKKNQKPLIPQAKLLRVLEIIAVLKGGGKNVHELAKRFKMSTRTIYRYFLLLAEVGFVIEKDFENNYFILSSENEPASTGFTLEETNTLKTMIQKGTLNSPLRSSLLKKLSLNSDLDDVPKVLVKMRIGGLIEKLASAIKKRKQVTLKNYHSANSNEIKDRVVEPFQFGTDYQTIVAFDIKDKTSKSFKLERIGEVVETRNKFKFEKKHTKTVSDIFGFSGDASNLVTLKLSLRAYLLLREEYPLAIPYAKKTPMGYIFHGPVTNFKGIGRFVLGLMNEIEIQNPKSFKEFIKEKLDSQKLV